MSRAAVPSVSTRVLAVIVSAVLPAVLAAVLAGSAVSCHKGADPIGLPDSYLLFVPATKDGQVRRGPTGLPVLEPLALDDSRAVPYHKLFSVGFAAELLRTDYLRKQFVREAQIDGKAFPADAREAAAEPTVFVLAGAPPFVPPGAGRGLATLGFFGGAGERGDASWIAVPPAPDSDTALAQTLSGRLGRAVATAIAAAGTTSAPVPPASVLIDGYAQAMEVIAREWRTGEGAARHARARRRHPGAARPVRRGAREQFRDHLRRRAAAAAQRRRAARRSRGGGDGALPAGAVEDGRPAGRARRGLRTVRVGARPGRASARPPCSARSGTSRPSCSRPGGAPSLRGPSAARHRRSRRGVRRAALPAERSEVIRMFVVTTYGATVKPGGVSVDGDSTASLAELTALAAEVARRPPAAASRRRIWTR